MNARMYMAMAIGLVATVEDVAKRRVSNWISIVALVAGVVCLSLERGWHGALSAVGGAIGGFLVFFIFYWLGGMGGGDVKLMAGLGAMVGIERLPEAALWTAGCGGVFAMVSVAASSLRKAWNRTGETAAPVRSIPYAPAIAVGCWLALWPKS